MALVVETGAGLANAESYGSVAESNAYHEAFTELVQWVGTAASGTLTIAVQPSDAETVTIGFAGTEKTYTFTTTAPVPDLDGTVLIGPDVAATRGNLVAAINLEPGAGILYAFSMTSNEDVGVASVAGDVITVEADANGTLGNMISTATTMVGAGNVWAGAFMTGGTNPSITDDDKENYLRQATQYFDAVWGRALGGYRTNSAQALYLPRTGMYVDACLLVPSGEVPVAAKAAVFELSGEIAKGTPLWRDSSDGSTGQQGPITKTRRKLDVLETETEYAAPTSSSSTSEEQRRKAFPKVAYIVRPLLAHSLGGSGWRHLSRG